MALSGNGYLTFTLPLGPRQRRELNIFQLHYRPGLKGGSYPWDQQTGGDTTRVKVRGTAKALRALAAELEVPLATVVALEAEIAERRGELQIVKGRALAAQLRAALDAAGQPQDEVAGALASPGERVVVRASQDPRRQVVVLRYGQTVVSRLWGSDACFTYLSATAAEDKARTLVADAEDSLSARIVSSVSLAAHARQRLSALAS